MSEYPKIKSFMEEINDAKISARKRSINTTEPIVLVGNLENCKVNINPSLYPEIVLSKIDYSALLELSGSYNAVTGSQFLSTQPQQRMKSK